MTTTTDTSAEDATDLDLASSAFWTSPSSYIALATIVLPIITTIFHKDTSQVAQAVSQMAPLLAAVALLVMRGLHKRQVVMSLTALKAERLVAAQRQVEQRAQHRHELDLKMLDRLPTAAAKAHYVKLTDHPAVAAA